MTDYSIKCGACISTAIFSSLEMARHYVDAHNGKKEHLDEDGKIIKRNHVCTITSLTKQKVNGKMQVVEKVVS